MKIRIEEDPSAKDLEITIRCRQTNESVIRILEMLRMTDQKLTGHRDGRTYILDADQIYYIDTVEKRTFLYTEQEVYETPFACMSWKTVWRAAISSGLPNLPSSILIRSSL